MTTRTSKQRLAFEELALPHTDALFGLALRLTRNERDAEDLVQEALLRAYRFWDKFEQGTNCKAWLYRITTNTFINRYHKDRRKHELAAMARQQDPATDDLISGEARRIARDPEGMLSARLFSQALQGALDDIPADFRLAVILADVEEMSYKEIADIMGCPVGTVMSRLYRGRKLLQKSLYRHAVEHGVVSPPAKETSSATKEDVVDLARFRAQQQARQGSR